MDNVTRSPFNLKVKEIRKRMLPNVLEYSIKDLIVFILILLVTIALGLFIFNQFVELKYKQYFLSQPCDLCKEINKQNRGFINWSNITLVSFPSSPEVDPLSPEVYPA